MGEDKMETGKGCVLEQDYCLIHGTPLHYDKRSGFEICYKCERDKCTCGPDYMDKECKRHFPKDETERPFGFDREEDFDV